MISLPFGLCPASALSEQSFDKIIPYVPENYKLFPKGFTHQAKIAPLFKEFPPPHGLSQVAAYTGIFRRL
jgi:hypothetical protein